MFRLVLALIVLAGVFAKPPGFKMPSFNKGSSSSSSSSSSTGFKAPSSSGFPSFKMPSFGGANFGGVTRAKPVPVKPAFAGGLVGSDVESPEFDPLGLSARKTADDLAWFRAAELKHGRVCMLACLGLWVQPAYHLPDSVFESTAGYGALVKLWAERPEAVIQIVLAIAAVETLSLFKNGQGTAGDLEWDPLGLQELYKFDLDDNKRKMQLKELKNGRLAMVGATAMLLQEAATGYGPYEQLFHVPGLTPK